ncbi:MAG TPA: SpoIIE family protein phosphatase [Acidobacteriota bacterium]|jgi:sigma-B regulation protein RsbU (phosphoserine phosphatase)|nr:SpoIIE family protein phosphatase [Acidobacteriota bacterium]
MDVLSDTLRNQLIDRRRRLTVLIQTSPAENLVGLLKQVDSALERLDDGRFGLCDVCHESIEPERLLADPLIRTCLDHLDPQEQAALERDLELAARVQWNLLPPRRQQLGGWEICFDYQPFRIASGDYCDVITGSNRLNVLLGDVSGKGVAASMLVANLHGLFRTLLPNGNDLTESLERANRIFCESTLASHYATLLIMSADASGHVDIANAGHCTPYVVTKDDVVSLPSTSVPLGVFADAKFSLAQVDLKPGDALFAYTDGLSEARNGLDQEYGAVQMERWLQSCRDLPSEELLRSCLKDLESFRSPDGLNDDLTVLLLKRRDS